MIKMLCPTCNSDDVERAQSKSRFLFICNVCEDEFHQFDAMTVEIEGIKQGGEYYEQ